MPQYRITSPDGTVYNVTAPEGATQEEALQRVMAQHPATAPVAPAAKPAAPSTLQKVAAPFAGYPSEVGREFKEGLAVEKSGLAQLQQPGIRNKFVGAAKYIGGPAEAMASPIGAAYTQFVDPALAAAAGKPIEKLTGGRIPSESTVAALELLTPSGVAKGMTEAGKVAKGAAEYAGSLGRVVRAGEEVAKPEGVAQNAAHALRATFAPESLGEGGAATEKTIRRAYGESARDTARSEAAIEPFARQAAAMTPEQQLAFYNHMEGRGAPLEKTPFAPVADTLRDAFKQRRTALESLSKTADMSFVQDYFPHMWTNPDKAQQFVSQWIGKQGATGALKKRTIPTIEDGLKAGLQLAEPNPLKAASRYINSMDRYIASQDTFETLRDQKYIKYFTPGAKRQPPSGWIPLVGRSAERVNPGTGRMEKAYAPLDVAQTYNNFFSEGWGKTPVGPVMADVRKLSNDVTKMRLGFSAYHGGTMALEGVISDAALGVKQLARGKPKGLATLAASPLAPVRRAVLGSRLKAQYFGTKDYGPQMEAVADGFAKAGGRFGMDPLFRNNMRQGFIKSFKRGELGGEVRNLRQAISDAAKTIPDRPIVGTAKTALEGVKAVGNLVSKAASDVAMPLFEKYIPNLKGGAYMSLMDDYITTHPGASKDEIEKYAIKAWDSIDNRFGEISRDNLFWNQKVKEVLPIIARAPTWDLGTLREIGGGVLDIPKSAKAMMEGKDISDRTAYVVALALTSAMVNGVYTYLKTGQKPSGRDYLAGRTGGVDIRTGAPERIMPPGYMKDVIGVATQPGRTISNKASDLLTTSYEAMTNKDFQGHKIADPKIEGWTQAFENYAKFMAGGLLVPFGAQQAVASSPPGSKISMPERAAGIRQAPLDIVDPARTAAMQRKFDLRDYKARMRAQARAKAQGGQ